MLTRIFLSACITVTACGATLTASAHDRGDPVVIGNLYNGKDTPSARTATQLDVNRLKRLRTRPSVKCARIEYVYQCLSSQNMHLTRTHCRAGATEASCCKGTRDYVNAKICGPVWNRLKKAGKTYLPGIWLCKCIEQPRRLKLRRTPIRPR